MHHQKLTKYLPCLFLNHSHTFFVRYDSSLCHYGNILEIYLNLNDRYHLEDLSIDGKILILYKRLIQKVSTVSL